MPSLSGPPEPHLAELRQVHLRPPLGQPLHPHVPAFGEPERRRPPSFRPEPDLPGAVRPARLVQVHQRLLETVSGRLPQPCQFRIGLGFGEFATLLRVVDPRSALPVLTTLIQTGISHGPANPGNLMGVRQLIRRELHPKTATHQHASMHTSKRRQQVASCCTHGSTRCSSIPSPRIARSAGAGKGAAVISCPRGSLLRSAAWPRPR